MYVCMYACMYVNYHGRELINRIIGLFRRLNRFDYTRCDITVSGLMDSFGCDLISVKIANFPTAVYSASLLTGFPLELGTGARK